MQIEKDSGSLHSRLWNSNDVALHISSRVNLFLFFNFWDDCMEQVAICGDKEAQQASTTRLQRMPVINSLFSGAYEPGRSSSGKTNQTGSAFLSLSREGVSGSKSTDNW